MSEMGSDDSHDSLPGVIPKPADAREWSMRALIAGVVVAGIMGASYPYIVLKLGFGPNVSVVAAFLGYLMLGIAFKNFTRWENNIVQTAGTSAAQTAFMCVILAAFDMLAQVPGSSFSFRPEWYESFVWLTFASILGILLAVPMRKHYIVDEKLTYADGVAAAETIIVLDARGHDARRAAIALFGATLASGIGWWLTQPSAGRLFGAWDADNHGAIPEVVFAAMGGLTWATAGGGFAVSLLSIGSGMIVGNRVNISMAIGAIIAWVIGPHVLLDAEVITKHGRSQIAMWRMWPGTGMLIAAGLTALLLKWRTLARTFSTLSGDAVQGGDVPLKWIGMGVAGASVGLILTQTMFFDLPWWMTIIAITLSVPLMLVGLRVLGETNWGPISQLTNMMQAVFAGLMSGNLKANLAASGTTGTIATQSEAIMQDYKAGHIIGSTPRFLTYSQLIAAPIGALAVALVYPMLRDAYGIGTQGTAPLSSPISARIANFADVLSEGFHKLPKYALEFMVVGAVVGIAITLGESLWKKGRKYLPSATGLGIGMMVPGVVVFTMVLGGILMSIWNKADKKSADKLSMPLASGLIAGEAIAAIIVAALVASGLMKA
ncbi:MAG: OPT family oligopeptide transporter [Kofleriaceae bacterium]|nr:OPT family oligopeptide transporter [Kofleriaceae bacterium]